MRKNILNFVYALAALFIAAAPASGQTIANGGFEAGNFSSWSTAANAQISTGFNEQSWLVTPADVYMARIEPINGQTRSTAESFLGLSSGSLVAFNPTIFNPTTNYGSIKQTVFLFAGQSITAYWNYVSQDYVPYNDGAIATLVGPGGQQIKLLAVTESAYGSPGAIVTGSYGSTDWQTVTFTASVAGSYTFGFSTFNDADQVLNPILFLDDAAGGTSAPGEPVVTTDAATNVTANSATSGGNVTSDGGSPVTARGVVYSTSPLPTLASSLTADGSGTGTFVSSLSGLMGSTTYYVRAYATNSVGTSYGNQVTFTTADPCNISASATASDALCNGSSDGSVDLTVTGGTAPFTYLWSNGATTEDPAGVPAGSYSVVVTDANNCTDDASATVGEPTPLVASAQATDALCNGDNGSIEVSAAGGTPGYTGTGTYSVAAGTYTYTVTDANGCTSEATATVNEPEELAVTGTASNVDCNGNASGSIDITVSGGTAPYSYNWSNGSTSEDASGLVAGTYSVTVTDDNGCSASGSYTVTEPAALACNTSVSPNPTVAGQLQYTIFLGYGPQSVSIDANVSGGTAPYSYSWSTGGTSSSVTVSPTSTTTYTVTITDANGCITTCTRTITVKDVRDGKKIFICHIPPGNPGNANTLSVASSAVAAHLAHGDYLGACNNARMTGNNGIAEEVAEHMHFHVYPNPNNGVFTVELPVKGTADVVITDVAGKVIFQQTLKDNTDQELHFDLGSEAKGLYFIRVNVGGELYQSKVSLQ